MDKNDVEVAAQPAVPFLHLTAIGSGRFDPNDEPSLSVEKENRADERDCARGRGAESEIR